MCDWAVCLQGKLPDVNKAKPDKDSQTQAELPDEQPPSWVKEQAGVNGPEAPPLTALSLLVQVRIWYLQQQGKPGCDGVISFPMLSLNVNTRSRHNSQSRPACGAWQGGTV